MASIEALYHCVRNKKGLHQNVSKRISKYCRVLHGKSPKQTLRVSIESGKMVLGFYEKEVGK